MQQLLLKAITTMTPQSAGDIKLSMELLMTHRKMDIIEELTNMENEGEVESISLSHILEMVELHVRHLSLEMGIEFVEQTSLHHIVTRLEVIHKMKTMPDDDFEYVELMYGEVLSLEFGTDILFETNQILDADRLYELQTNYLERFEEMNVALQDGVVSFIPLFVNYVRIIGHNAIPEEFKNISEIENSSFKYLFISTNFNKYDVETTARSILLMTILDPEMRGYLRDERLHVIDRFTTKIDRGNYMSVKKEYVRLVTEFYK
jgi:hypothetical protein